ncbi:MAG: chlorophyll a/b binding light-harvesting protein [Cyanobacteria bacterium P01_F01_bin.42]
MTTGLSPEVSWAASQPDREWLIGNARLVDYSGLLLGAHIAHAGLIMLWAGTTAIVEALQFSPEVSLPEQGAILLPHLATLGFGIDASGTIVDPYPFFVVGALHLVSSAVLGAGGLYHSLKGPKKLNNEFGWARKFHYDWADGSSLSLVLGHHLIMLGIAARLFVYKAIYWGGIYDPDLHAVRIVEHPTLNPLVIFGYLVGLHNGTWTAWGLASVDTLEDLVGGHAWISAILILGGIFHLVARPAKWALKRLRLSGDAILSYSLGSLAFMGFVSCAFIAHCNLVFPPEFYGTQRFTMVNAQLLVATLALGGHLWHAYRARTLMPQIEGPSEA